MRLFNTAYVVTLPVLYMPMSVCVHIQNGVCYLFGLVHITLNVFVKLYCATDSNN